MSESGIIDVFLLFGPTPAQIYRQYTALTGLPAMPPLFALGYHQSRWNYNDEADVDAVDQGFDEQDIPYDVIWLDIEHTDGKRYFTWDPVKFANPQQMQEKLRSKGRKLVTIADPHIKRDSGYFLHKEATSRGVYVKDRDGKDFEGWCWPGSSSYIDFSDPAARTLWAEKVKNYQGGLHDVVYLWIDMNEPSVFNGPEVTMFKDNLHHGGWEHRDVHNLFGFYQHMASYHAQLGRTVTPSRPFILTRSFFAGSQRYGATWTGDNMGTWNHLAASMPMLQSLNLAGMPFCGADVGGFFGNPGAELVLRWYQAGAFQPFFRGHAHIDSKRREPWLFGEPYTAHIREAVRQRYRLLPFWYTLFHETHLTGMPVMRALWIEFGRDARALDRQASFMVGNALLVHPITAEGQTSVSVYLPGPPEEFWYDWVSRERLAAGREHHVAAPLSKIPVFLRSGTVVPTRQRLRRASSRMSEDPLTLVIALDSRSRASGHFYLDDELSFAYQQGHYVWKEVTALGLNASEPDGLTIRVADAQQSKPSSKYLSPVRIDQVVVLGVPRIVRAVRLSFADGTSKPVTFDFHFIRKEVTLHKLFVPAGQDWSLHFTYKKEE